MRDSKILKVIICIIAFVFVVHQVYSSTYKPITTVSAEYFTATEGSQIDAFVIREEKIIDSNVSGVLHFVVSDGERVSKNGIIANIYSDADASVSVNRMEQLKSRISDIEEMQGYNDIEAADINLANKKVNDSLNALVRSVATDDFSNAETNSSQLLNNISRRQMITGEQTDFSQYLTELKSELEMLNASLPASIGSINSDTSGYFMSAIDGYETKLSCDVLDQITSEYLDGLKVDTVSEKAIGKIVSGYTWYIAASIGISESLKYKTGDTLTLKTTLKSTPEINVTVDRINVSSSDNTAVIILSCNQMNSELAGIRRDTMTIVNNTYSGLKIPTKALRLQNEQTGVFVRSGMMVKFVSVNVIYRTDEYVICEQQISNDTVLRLYDDVIVKGKRLYDGKIID